MEKHITTCGQSTFCSVLVFGFGATFYIFSKETKTIFAASSIETDKRDNIGESNQTSLTQKTY